MSRPLRIEISDGWYHVMNRGLRRHATFTDDKDHAIFLETLEQASLMFGVNVGAYCLMPNHYHLLIQTPNANLSRFMRHVNGVYTQRFNRKNGKDGPLFRGRYRALIVDADSYLLQVVRYIHSNPAKARLVQRPESFRWSSHRFYLNSKRAPEWLCVKEMLTWFSSRPGHALQLYKKFMKEAPDPHFEEKYERKHLGWILGEGSFLEKMKRKVAKKKTNGKEIPQSRKVKGEAQLDQLARTICQKLKINKEDLLVSRPGKRNLLRKVAIHLAWETTGLAQRVIADYFGVNSHRTVAVHHFNVKRLAQKDPALSRLIKSLKSTFSQ